MDRDTYDEILSKGILSTLFASLCLFIFALGLVVCWKYWKLSRAYKDFPSKRVEIRWLYPALMGKYSKNVSFSNVVFQDLLGISKTFQSEGFYLIWFFRPFLVIYNKEFTKTFFKLPGLEKASVYDYARDVLGNSIITSKDEEWKVHNKLLSPAIQLGAFKDKMHIFNDNAALLVEELENVAGKPTDDVLSLLEYYNFNILGETLLGVKVNDEKRRQKVMNYMKMMKEIFDFLSYKLVRPWIRWKFLARGFRSGRKYWETVNEVRRFTTEVIDEMQKSLSDNALPQSDYEGKTRKSFAQVLLEQNQNDPVFTSDDIRDQVLTFMIGGYNTSSNTLMWCLYLLGHHQEIQEKAFKEVEEIISTENVTLDDIGNMKYLECVIKETLRVYCTAPLFGKRTTKEIKCGKYTVPKDTDIIFFPFMLHRNPNVYPNPEKFDPERFSENSNIESWMHIPFAEGYRSCIGKKFAMMEMKVFLVHILRRFQITTLNKIHDSELGFNVVLRLTKPVRMLFTLRQ